MAKTLEDWKDAYYEQQALHTEARGMLCQERDSWKAKAEEAIAALSKSQKMLDALNGQGAAFWQDEFRKAADGRRAMVERNSELRDELEIAEATARERVAYAEKLARGLRQIRDYHTDQAETWLEAEKAGLTLTAADMVALHGGYAGAASSWLSESPQLGTSNAGQTVTVQPVSNAGEPVSNAVPPACNAEIEAMPSITEFPTIHRLMTTPLDKTFGYQGPELCAEARRLGFLYRDALYAARHQGESSERPAVISEEKP